MCRLREEKIMECKENLLSLLKNKELSMYQIVKHIENDICLLMGEGYKAAGEQLFNLLELIAKGISVSREEFIRIYYDKAAYELCLQNNIEKQQEDEQDFEKVLILYACQL